MYNLHPAVFNWSGGKDSMLALHHVLLQKEFDVRYLLTTVNESFHRIAMHGVREALLLKQVNSLGLPLLQLNLPEMPDMETYELIIGQQMSVLRQAGITHSIYGDIFLEDLKLYREAQLDEYAIKGVFPLWKKDSSTLVKEFITLGYRTIVVCAQGGLEDFCGRVIDQQFLDDLPDGIDPCGENGEFHTFVFDGPMFKYPVNFELGERVYRSFPDPNGGTATGFWYIDLVPTT